MSGSVGKSDSSSSSNQSFNQNVWAPQGEALQNMYGQLGNMFGNTTQGAKGATKAGANIMNDVASPLQNSMNQNLQGGAYQGMGLQNSLMNSLNQSLNSPSATQEVNQMIMGGAGNNYADAMRGQYIDDANQATNNMLANMDARAAAAGMSGGSRHGMAIGRGFEGINRNLQRNLAETGYNTFDRDLDRKLAIAQQADQGTLQRQQMLGNLIGQQQGTMNQGYQQGLNLGQYGQGIANLPWQQAQMYGSILGGPTTLSSGMGSSNANSKSMAASGGAK